MSERNGYEPGVPCAVSTMQPDPEAGAAFYGDLFGWELEPAEGHLVAKLRGREVAAVAPLAPGVEPPPDPAWITNVNVESADDTAARAREAGGRVVAEPFDLPTGRIAVIADPTGGVLCVWEAGGGGGAQLVNEPGAWAMSQLETADPEGAAAFYGAVFGWTTESFDMGESTFTMFRLPGYVGGEPEQPVSREVVATMSQAESGAPARWIVDFWVDDIDGVAAKADELDGAVVAGPLDIPVGRTAVLADPAGVSFTVTQIAGAAA